MASSKSSSATAGAKHRLMSELAELGKEKWVNIDVSAIARFLGL